MKRYLIVLGSAAIVLFFTLTGFECASPEMTSARLALQQKNYDKALEALHKETAKNPTADEAYYLMGYLYGERENIDAMVENFNKSLSISKKYEKEIKQAKKSYWGTSFNKAVAFVKKAQNNPSKDSSTVYLEKAASMFRQAIKAEPDSVDTYRNLAFICFNLGKNDDAIEPLNKMIEMKKSVDAYRFLGQIYYNKGIELKTGYERSKDAADSVAYMAMFEKAIGVLESGKAIHGTDSDILLYLSNSYIAAGKATVAIDVFKQGVVADPANKYYRFNYAVLLRGKMDFEEAEKQFKAAMEIDSKYLNAEYHMAINYWNWGISLQKLADEAGKENPAIKEKYTLGLPLMEAYVQQKADDAAGWELLAKLYSKLSMNDDANKAFEKADKLRSNK